MAKEFKRKNNKDFKRKSFDNKKGRNNEYDEKPTFKRDRDNATFNKNKNGFDNEKTITKTKKNDKKVGFERYRDDSKPSDFGTTKSSTFNKKRESIQTSSSFRNKEDREESKPFHKKTFSNKTSSTKKRSDINPNDLDESDFEYGKSETKNFKKKAYEKNPYEKKTWNSKKNTSSKPQRSIDDGMVRLNKFIANAGICSRREADDLISSGVVQVNGKTITEMGYRIKPTDIIKYGGQTLRKERMVYLILNKPKDYITTADDPQKRKTVLELIQGACKERIYPVGRLDRATTGLLMFTNDGDITKKLTHPKYGVRKIYHVELDKPLKREHLNEIEAGIELEDGLIKVDEVSYVGDGKDKTQIGIEIHSGKNRIVRRIFEHLGYNVRKLDRVMFGPLTKKDLPRGRWRLLTESEVGMLKMISAE